MNHPRGVPAGRGHSGPAGQRRPSSPDPHADTVTKHWPDYLRGGYFDDAGHLKIEYVSRERVEPLVQAMCGDRVGLTAHQVRRYFGHCRAIETRLKAVGDEKRAELWKDLLPEVKKLDIAAADGAAKQPAKIPAIFHVFIRRNVAAIKTDKDFLRGFLPHFEALVGFGQAYFRKERG